MSDEESSLSVKTPWGALTKANATQMIFEQVINEIAQLTKRIKQLESTDLTSKPIEVESLLTKLLELEQQMQFMNQRIEDLDQRFNRFSRKVLDFIDKRVD